MEHSPSLSKSHSYSVLYIVFIGLIVACIAFTVHDLKQSDASHSASIKVQRGDTLWSLSEKYKGKMSAAQFMSWVETNNQLHNRDQIKAGQTLLIPTDQNEPGGTANQIAGAGVPH
ncbi:LysM peptidoglycan-binding domain-containing protein [Pullulanibacillus sp. KACC 23026]|uniref:cell division suppressor protein YneA n=1 Tax=Pullulanibacillus sp. KACC 23026 TaxID=3028315 RepID=UPI0023AEC6D6|nr:LysM peptidoglycan-binding domain-containing protein [Pullulanibacillus sp. KACC 23026]WEG11532.1 LysM peptidoglycan-binding domain-containing protein [Pullulanibacillus sp. KACC 23026]